MYKRTSHKEARKPSTKNTFVKRKILVLNDFPSKNGKTKLNTYEIRKKTRS